MEKIKNWKDQEIDIITSTGSGVKSTFNPFDNLIRTGINPWPTPEIVQKLYESRQGRAFKEEIKSSIEYYTDLQSLNSEDAIVWSVFGTLIYSPKASQIEFVKSFLQLIEIEDQVEDCNIWLWRRIPHPETLVSGGPEIDFGIHTKRTLILGEAKWNSGIGQNQGKLNNKSQLALRKEFLDIYSPKIYNSEIVKTISLLRQSNSSNNNELKWEQIIDLPHPLKDEIIDYYNWKVRNSK